MRQLRDAFALVPFARLLGMEFESATRGAAIFTLDLRPDLTRMGDILHGGALASLIDTAAAFAVHTLLEPAQRTVTVDLTIHYLRPVTGGQIRAIARVLRDGRRIAIVAVEVRDASDALVSTATTTYAKQTPP